MSPLYIIVIIIALVAVMVISIYNALIHLRQKTDESWSGITVQLKRRHDLVPTLVSTVKGYAAHEAKTLQDVIEARQQAVNLDGLEKMQNAPKTAEIENMLSQTLKSMFALSENYPDLKASQNFLDLQQNLQEIEDQISASRRIYNSNAQMYNTKREVFPSNIISNGFKFEKANYFEVSESEQKIIETAPEVKF